MNILKLLFICSFLLASCKKPGSRHEKRHTGHFYDDTSFHKMKCGLYINRTGKIAYQDFDKPQCDTCDCGYGYISNVCYAIRDDKDGEQYEYRDLATLIDTNALVFLNGLYFKDKSNVFYFHNMMEGGTIYRVANANPSSFKTFTKFSQQYGYDRKNYFNGSETLTHHEVKYLGLDTLK